MSDGHLLAIRANLVHYREARISDAAIHDGHGWEVSMQVTTRTAAQFAADLDQTISDLLAEVDRLRADRAHLIEGLTRAWARINRLTAGSIEEWAWTHTPTSPESDLHVAVTRERVVSEMPPHATLVGRRVTPWRPVGGRDA